MSDGKVVFKYVGDTSGIDKANTEAEGKVGNLGSKLGGIAGKAALAIGAAAVAATTAVVKIGSDFESAFTGVIKVIDATDEEIAGLREGILDMSKVLPASAAEIAGVAQAAGQLGIETGNVLDFTRAMIDLGESTNLTAEQAATELARFANIMQMPQTEFDKLGSTIVALGNNSATTEAEIVSMGMRLAGAGKQAGLSEADIMGFAAALSSVGIEAEAGGTAFSRVMTNINIAVQTGSEKLSQYASVAGMSASEFQQAFEKDAASAIAAFVTGLGEIEKQGGSTVMMLEEMGISEIRMRDALLRSAGAGDLLTKSLQIGSEAWEENIALSKEATLRYETLESRFEMLKNQVSAVAISIYDEMRPALSDALDAFTDLFTKLEEDGTLDELSESLSNVASILADSLAGILPVILDLFNALIKPLVDIVETLLPPLLSIIESLAPLLEIIFELLGPLIDMLTGPLALALGIIADALSIIVGLIGLIIEGVKWLMGQSTDFDKYLKMLERPFSEQGSTYNAVKAQADKINRDLYDARSKPYVSTVGTQTGAADADLSDAEWYAKYFGAGRNASGTSFWRGGWSWVGEEGPELVNIPVGAQILPADISARMASSPNVTNNAGTMINELNVYPDSAEYQRILGLLETSDRARQATRAGGL